MRSEQQHIDDFFRNKEEEWTPDSSRLQAHWQQMNTLLTTPAAPPAGKKFRMHTSQRIIKLLGGFAVVTVVTLVTLTATRSKKTIPATTRTPVAVINPAKPAPQKTTADAVSVKTAPPAKQAKETSITSKPAQQVSKQPAKAATTILSRNKKVSLPQATHSVEPRRKGVNAAKMIDDFYSGFKKTPQQFSIQPGRANTLTAKEGTRLIIPADAFVNGNGDLVKQTVKIVITEYYSYDDIAAAKLSTTSNGEQLVTAGMLHIKAESNGDPVQVAPGKAVEINMPAQKTDDRMQLFIGTTSSVNLADLKTVDTLSYESEGTVNTSAINWVPVEWQKAEYVRKPKPTINTLDISIDPHRVNYGKKATTAKFLVDNNVNMSDEEIKQLLYKRYGAYYDKIKIRRSGRRNNSSRIDTVFGMDLNEASRLKLISKVDSVQAMEKFKKDSAAWAAVQVKLSGYTFTTKTLGWINCDRFLKDNAPKANFTVNLGEGFYAGNFISQLVFTRYRSVMNYSYVRDNKIYFANIPINEPVQIISVGVKDGKVVSCIQSLTTSGKEVTSLNFEETTPGEFRKKLGSILVTQ